MIYDNTQIYFAIQAVFYMEWHFWIIIYTTFTSKHSCDFRIHWTFNEHLLYIKPLLSVKL